MDPQDTEIEAVATAVKKYFSETNPRGHEEFKDLIRKVIREEPKTFVHQSEIFADTIKARHVGEGVRYTRSGLAADKPDTPENIEATYFETDTGILYQSNSDATAWVAINPTEATTDTKNISLPAFCWWPSTTSGCAALTKTELGTNDVDIQTLDFDTSADEFAQTTVDMPDDWNAGTITAKFKWTAASGTGTVNWALQGRALAEGDALDQAWGTAAAVTDTLTTANDEHISDSTAAITLAGTPAAGQRIHLRIQRDVSEDSLGVDAKLISVFIAYTINL